MANLPAWLVDHFRSGLDAHERVTRVVNLCEYGISVLTRMPKFAEAMSAVKGTEDDEDEKAKIDRLADNAEFAQREIEADYPTLRSLAIIGMWSWLEAFVKDLVVIWIIHKPECLNGEEFKKIKVDLVTFSRLNKRTRAHYLLGELDAPGKRPQGINRFESLLACVDLSGPVSHDLREAIFEMQQVRNVIAHNNGNADSHLKRNCPWLNVKVGQRVDLSPQRLKAYSQATTQYLTQLMIRVGDAHDYDFRPDLVQVQSDFKGVRNIPVRRKRAKPKVAKSSQLT